MFTIKLREFTNTSHAWLALGVSTRHEDHCDDFNILHVAIGKFGWYFSIPPYIKPKEKWVDLTNRDWATERNGKKGYTDQIRREYGFRCTEDAIHVHYGIQPGSWSRDDKENSDHTKLFSYFWNLVHVRHDCYFADGSYASNGNHFSEWEYQINSTPYNKETREADFLKVERFVYPKTDLVTSNTLPYRPYNNFGDGRSSNTIYKFFDYIDQYDNSKTVARVNIEEREWIRGKWSWMRYLLKHIPGCRKIQRTMDIAFRDEMGSRKESWKGGTIGMGFGMLPNETMDQCWERFVVSDSRP